MLNKHQHSPASTAAASTQESVQTNKTLDKALQSDLAFIFHTRLTRHGNVVSWSSTVVWYWNAGQRLLFGGQSFFAAIVVRFWELYPKGDAKSIPDCSEGRKGRARADPNWATTFQLVQNQKLLPSLCLNKRLSFPAFRVLIKHSVHYCCLFARRLERGPALGKKGNNNSQAAQNKEESIIV